MVMFSQRQFWDLGILEISHILSREELVGLANIIYGNVKYVQNHFEQQGCFGLYVDLSILEKKKSCVCQLCFLVFITCFHSC